MRLTAGYMTASSPERATITGFRPPAGPQGTQMPQAAPDTIKDMQALADGRQGLLALDELARWLLSQAGYAFDRGVIRGPSPLTIDDVTKRNAIGTCIDYLCDEWDYGSEWT